jgi:hypothetical protein
MDLTRVSGCYSKELREACYIIKLMVKEASISVDDMIKTVKAIIDPAYINAEAKQRFINNLEACQSKEAVDELCGTAVRNGMYYKAGKKKVVA